MRRRGELDSLLHCRVEDSAGLISVGFVCGKQGCVHGLHAGGAGEGAHQPGVDAVHMVNVQAGQEPDGVAVLKVHHTDDTLFDFLIRRF